MPDDSKPSEPVPKARRTRTAEVADAVSEAGVRIARLSPQQVMTIICVMAFGFICSAQAFQAWSDREERREAARDRLDATASQIRENNAQSELTRQHCASESTNLRAFFAEQNDRRMRFEADERAKDRAALATLVMRLGDLERAIGRK